MLRKDLVLFLGCLFLSLRYIHAYSLIDSFAMGELLSSSSEDYIARLSLNNSEPRSHFMHLNRTRVPGSKESIYVQNYIISHFEALNKNSTVLWEVEIDNFTEKQFNFTNLIFTKKPSESIEQQIKYIVLAAHYDTLIHPKGFIGAIDSAVSCGLLLDLSETLNSLIDSQFSQFHNDVNLGIKILFFDGEEALKKWSPKDSIYGSKHLFQEWNSQGKIRNIELLVLLDLLGADINYVPSYFAQTHRIYNELSSIENRLISAYPDVFSSYQDKYFAPPRDLFHQEINGHIEDDHIPFMIGGVPILHLIPHRFPGIWHTMEDNFSNINLNAVLRWKLIFHTFLIEYLELL